MARRGQVGAAVVDLAAPVFPSKSNPSERLSPNTGVYILETIFEQAGVTNASSDSLRTTHVNMLQRNVTDRRSLEDRA